MGENAIGIVGRNSNIRDVTLRNIDYIRKPSGNLPLKGSTLDLSPAAEEVWVDEDCALFVTGTDGVTLENIHTHGLKISLPR